MFRASAAEIGQDVAEVDPKLGKSGEYLRAVYPETGAAKRNALNYVQHFVAAPAALHWRNARSNHRIADPQSAHHINTADGGRSCRAAAGCAEWETRGLDPIEVTGGRQAETPGAPALVRHGLQGGRTHDFAVSADRCPHVQGRGHREGDTASPKALPTRASPGLPSISLRIVSWELHQANEQVLDLAMSPFLFALELHASTRSKRTTFLASADALRLCHICARSLCLTNYAPHSYRSSLCFLPLSNPETNLPPHDP